MAFWFALVKGFEKKSPMRFFVGAWIEHSVSEKWDDVRGGGDIPALALTLAPLPRFGLVGRNGGVGG